MSFFKASVPGSKWGRNAHGTTSRYVSDSRIVQDTPVDSDGGFLDRKRLNEIVLAYLGTRVSYAHASGWTCLYQ